MASVCCLVGAAPQDIPRLAAALAAALGDVEITLALFDVAMLHAIHPIAIVVDMDSMNVDPFEALRQLRFVLPNCALVVYAGSLSPAQLPGLHNAGANALIAKGSSEAQVAAGLRRALGSGCFTDPNFSVAVE